MLTVAAIGSADLEAVGKEIRMTAQESQSPRIADVSWGSVLVQGRAGAFKDAKLYPGGAREWDWRETGTDHRPGVQPADVQELLDHGATIVVVAQGFSGRLQVTEETRRMLEDRGIDLHMLSTEPAVDLYNDLRTTDPVGALIHSTC
jgi:hypothetical protein